MNLPNLLTTIRLVTVLPLLILLNATVNDGYKYALAIFSFSMLTDVLDGHFARKLKKVSDFGKFYDAVVDKIVIYAVLFSLYASGVIKYYVIFPMFMRDMIVDSLRSLASRNDVIIGANVYGKLKFLLQTLSVIIALLYLDPFGKDCPVLVALANVCLVGAFLVSFGGLKAVYSQVKSWNRGS